MTDFIATSQPTRSSPAPSQDVGKVDRKLRLAFLDSLRGWAAISVLMYHTALIPQPALHVPKWASLIVLNGGTGVTLFFVTSAFSLCLAARQNGTRGDILKFALRRVFRIAPLFYAVLALSLLRDYWIFGVLHTPLSLLSNVLFVFNFLPGQETGIVWASWTIGVEILFYVLFPVISLWARDIKSACLAVVTMLLIETLWYTSSLWAFADPSALLSQGQYGIVHHLPVFAFGILAYRIFEKINKLHLHSSSLGACLIVCGIYLYISLLSGRIGVGIFRDSYYWQAVVFSIILLGVSFCPSRIVVNKATVYIGKVSYSVYLIHPLVVYSLISTYNKVQDHYSLPTVSYWSCFAMTLLATVAISSLTHRYIEVPGMRAGARLIASLDPMRRNQAALAVAHPAQLVRVEPANSAPEQKLSS